MIEEDEFSSDETNPIRSSSGIKIDNELYKEENDIPYNAISVKRAKLPKGGEDWEIYENKSKALVLKGTRFTKSEKNFLRTANGVIFLLRGYKAGLKSIAQFKKALVKEIKEKK